MGTEFGFLRVNGAIKVFVNGSPDRQGVVVGTDQIGLALMCVRIYTCTGWRNEAEAKAEYVPWHNIQRVSPMGAAELDELNLRPLFDAAGYKPHDGTANGSRVDFQGAWQ